MKKSLIVLLVGLSTSWGYAQLDVRNDMIRERVVANLKYLSNDYDIVDRVQIDSKGVIIYKDVNHGAIDFSLRWTEAERFIEIVENWDYYTMVKTFAEKGSSVFNEGEIEHLTLKYQSLPTEWEGLSVALDPGHFGGNMDEGKLEARYAKFRAKDIGKRRDIEFYEADLNYNICLILQRLIENAGGKVLITRPYATSALGKSFKDWLQDDFKKDLESAYTKGDMPKEQYDFLNTTKDYTLVFETFYKFLEFRKRAELIHNFQPDVTFIVHLNSKEGNRRFGARYLPPVEENYNMAFVPGGFLSDELRKTDQLVDFSRLLISQDIENSIRLADFVLSAHSEILEVPRIPKENNLKVLREVSVATPFEGVYARNLALTRMSRGAVVYGESLYQDNSQELIRLSDTDYEILVPGIGKKKIPFRCKQIADSYFKGLETFLTSNKQLQKKEAAEDRKNRN